MRTVRRVDVLVGACLAAAAGCATIVATAPLYLHHVVVRAQGGAGYATASESYLGHLGSLFLSIGLIESGALAMITISASTAYVIDERLPRPGSGFNAPLRRSWPFRLANVAVAAAAAAVTLIPGAPLLSIVLNANLLSVVLIPPALVFLLLLANDHDVVGDQALSKTSNVGAVILIVLIFVAVGAYVISSFVRGV